jgi:hypothetical protein
MYDYFSNITIVKNLLLTGRYSLFPKQKVHHAIQLIYTLKGTVEREES